MLSTTLKIFGFILIVFLSFHSNGQQWVVYMEDESVKIEYSTLNIFTDSLVGEQILFRYSNKSDEKLKLKFIRRIRYSAAESQKTSKHKYKLELEPNQIVQGKLTDGLKENTLCHLFLGWKQKQRKVESFRIEKIGHKIVK